MSLLCFVCLACDVRWRGLAGEPTPYNWPDVNSHFGSLDLAGFPKDRFFYYKAWNTPDVPFIYLFPHWKYALFQLLA